MAEIFHVLAFRGFKVPLEDVMTIIERIIEDGSIVKVPTTADTVKEALEGALRLEFIFGTSCASYRLGSM